jgi:sterol desaturase/sphingolipid hydroxylase (fatty acid hydroxylase superfamily)
MARLQDRAERLAMVAVFPLLFGSSIYAAWRLKTQGVGAFTIMAACFVIYAVLLSLLESWIPYEDEWKGVRPDTKVDFGFFSLNQSFTPAFEYVTFVSALWVRRGLGLEASTLWEHFPFWVQVALLVAVSDLLHYFYHRRCHEKSGWLWTLHSVHHSSERLYWLNTSRMHPLDHFFNILLRLGTKVFLGAPEDVMFMATFVYSFHGLFTHANINLRLGPLNYLFSATELHRWHHARSIADANANYGGCTIIWDILFGTRRLPTRPLERDQVGLNDNPVPTLFLQQLVHPFRSVRREPG